MSEPIRIGVVAAEQSGDMHGARLVAAIRQLAPNVRFYGICGEEMRKQGVEQLYPMDRLTVIGIDGLLKDLLPILQLRKRLYQQFLADPPHLFLAIDAPDFNLWLEGKLRQQGITTVHYICPTFWGWRHYRVKKIRKAVSHILSIFPFEQKLLDQEGIASSFVGHPIAREISEDPDLILENADDFPDRIALLPGSRRSEILHLAPIFIKVAEKILRAYPDMRFIAALAKQADAERFEKTLAQNANSLPIEISVGQARKEMVRCGMSIVASGTASLESVLLERPTVVAYRISPLNYFLIHSLSSLSHYAMPNLLLDEPIVPEFIQQQCKVENIANAALHYLKQPALMRQHRRLFRELRLGLLTTPNSSAAEEVLRLATGRGK